MKFPSIEDLTDAMSDGTTGFCLECGHMQDGCEPDAVEYGCENCGKNAVYGAEEILLMQ